VVTDHDADAHRNGAGRAADAIGELLHARADFAAADMAELYRLVGDLARLAHATADATTILTNRIDVVHDTGRLHHDDTRRPVPTPTVDGTRTALERARHALATAGEQLEAAHNTISHFYVTDPVLRAVPDLVDVDDDAVGEST